MKGNKASKRINKRGTNKINQCLLVTKETFSFGNCPSKVFFEKVKIDILKNNSPINLEIGDYR